MSQSAGACGIGKSQKKRLLPSLTCSSERYKLSDLSRLLQTDGEAVDEDIGLILMKRLKIPNKNLKITEWMTICTVHKDYLHKDFPLEKNKCALCKGVKFLKRVSARRQDGLGEVLVGESICIECEKSIKKNEMENNLPTGQIWVTLDNSFRIIYSSVPSLRLLCRGLISKEPISNPPELSIRDAIEIRRSLDNSNHINREFLLDRLVSLGIIPHTSEFRPTADACIKMLQSLLSIPGEKKYKKAFRFLNLPLGSLAFLPDENKSSNSGKLEHFAFLKNGLACKILCLSCDKENCTGCSRPSYPSPISLGDSLGRHLHYLQSTCRCCKKRTTSFHSHPRGSSPESCNAFNNCKLNYVDGFKRLLGVNVVTEDDYEVHPQVVCGGCRPYLSSATSPVSGGFPSFTPHNQDFCDCDLKFVYANASVQESGSSLSVVMNFSRIPSLTHLAGMRLLNAFNHRVFTVKMALEIYQTFMYVQNKKSPDCYEYFKSLSLAGVLRCPIKVTFHNKANAFQTVLTLLCESFMASSCSKKDRANFRRKVETILDADFYETEPSLRHSKKTVKFRRNYFISSMCVICSNLNCEGLCTSPFKVPSEPFKRPKRITSKEDRNSFGRKSNLEKDNEFIPDTEVKTVCVNCPNLACKGCSLSGFEKENLKLKLGLDRLPSAKELSIYLLTGSFIEEPVLKSKKRLKSDECLSTSSSPESSNKKINNNNADATPSSQPEFFSHCPDCKFYFRREHIYLKHLETCVPGSTSLSCSTCSRNFKSEIGMLKHSCEGINSLENHQYKNIALNLDPMDYESFIKYLLSPALPDPWRATPRSKEETLLIEKEGTPFQFVISRYKQFSNKARLKGEGVKSFKEEIWPLIIQRPQNEGEELKCPGCYLDHFLCLSDLDQHQVECSDYLAFAGDLFECDGCDKTFSLEMEYIKHIKCCELIEIPEDIRSLYPDDKGQIFCPGCSTRFIDDELEYFRHLKMCHLVEFENFPCSHCHGKFSTKKTLYSHKCVRPKPSPSSTITSSSKRDPSEGIINSPPLKRLKGSNDTYEPVCKMGDYKCPICGLKFILNQPYGYHVKNTECVSLNASIVPYTLNEIREAQGLIFASLILNFSSHENGSSGCSTLKMKYGRVPSLRLLCRGITSSKKLIPRSKSPPLSIKEALELYQSIKKSILSTSLNKERLWEWIRTYFLRHYGDFESFESILIKRRRALIALTNGLKSLSITPESRHQWISKIRIYLSIPLHDQFYEETIESQETTSFKVLEYPSSTKADRKSIIQLLCLKCMDIVCIGCEGNSTLSIRTYHKEVGKSVSSEELLQECTKVGRSLGLRRRVSVQELLAQERRNRDQTNGTEKVESKSLERFNSEGIHGKILMKTNGEKMNAFPWITAMKQGESILPE